MKLLVTHIKFNYSANTNHFHPPITENVKQQIEAETKNLLWDACDKQSLIDAIEETYGWYVDEIKFDAKK